MRCLSDLPAIWWWASGSAVTTINPWAGLRAAPAPAEIWRRFMGSAIAIDGRRGPPFACGIPRSGAQAGTQEPLPDEWSEGGETLRSIFKAIERLIDKN
jgi:hypothetical protein